MPVAFVQSSLRPNHLLAKLTDEHYQALCPQLEIVHLVLKQVLYERDQPISHVYFPCKSVLSCLIFMQSGAAIEVGTIGNEGFSGAELLVGATLATESMVCQIAGDSIRMKSEDFREAVKGASPLRHVAQCYMQGYLSQIFQSVACNRLHSTQARFARWMLVTHDRVQGNEFHLTQDFLADMLGVHRPSVSLVAAAFQKAGIIEYSRGNVKILNRAALEQASCECYATVRTQFKRLFGIAYG
jgi:hypothetical protein